MRAVQTALVLAVVTVGLACQRGPGMCPEGARPDKGRPGDGKSLWCKTSKDGTPVWVELWSPTERRQACSYRAGRPDGAFQAWHRNGKRWLEGRYRDGEKAGQWVQWDKDGNRVAEGEYRGGRLVSGAPVGMVARCEEQKP